ncbi:MAG TPA: aminotransferase class V-fold PLP-dependent enzyme [Candidatus Acidoferrum sp.]|nr:aminotransferase class V-fold PLP-dependent enzyme [Candidatus Acidoferrum sp.]
MKTENAMATNFRAEWFEFEDVAYLNVAGQGPLPRAAIRAAQNSLEWKKFPHKMPEEAYFGLPGRVRALLAQMIGAQPEDIALTTGASTGMAAVAHGLKWKPDDEVLIAKGEFPAHFATWVPLQEAGKLRVRVVQPRERFLTTDDLIAAITPRTRLISTSHMRFDDGALCDAPRLAAAAHAAGALLLLDAAQSVGAVPMNIGELGADFVVASGYKWLLGPYGTGFFWARGDRTAEMQPDSGYWGALESASDFTRLSSGEVKFKKDASRWDMPETSNMFNLAPLEASLEFLLRIGVKTVWDHCRAFCEQVIERLPIDRCVLASPADARARGQYVCVAARKSENTPQLFKKLTEAGVFVSLREGALRIAPHLYNTDRDADRLIRALTV